MAGLGLSTIGQIAVPVRDIERATAFYRDVLGMKYLFSAGNLSFFDCDGVRLMLDIVEDKRFDHPASVIYYKVDDIQPATALLRGKGVVVVGEPHIIAPMADHDLWMAFFEDPDENVFSLMCEVPRKT
jgi:methylmalonyl-CoA/ethylmalonyl-CoA epimerase